MTTDPTPTPINVIAIEGVHGSGKSTLCNFIKKFSDRFIVLDEAFINEPGTQEVIQKPNPYPLNPQGLVRETLWTAKWFSRIVDMREQCEGKIVVVDRSPYSAMAYVQPQSAAPLLEPIISESLRELREKCHINVRIMYLRVESQEVLFERITKRLNEVRQELNEGSKDHLAGVHRFYESMMNTWDVIVSNEEQNLANLEQVFCEFEAMVK